MHLANLPILQFGTSRLLQAHVNLFVSQALAQGAALGKISVVETAAGAGRAHRVRALNEAANGFPVRLRGKIKGEAVYDEVQVSSVGQAVHADEHWNWVREQVAGPVRVIVSNTGDHGFALHLDDHAGLLDGPVAPRSFPAKLLALLAARYRNGAAPLTVLACEQVWRNGSVLRDLVLGLARGWRLEDGLIAYLQDTCVWGNTLVDRIVGEAIAPVGTVTEHHGLWAIEAQPNLVLPCRHPAMCVTGELAPYVQRKLFLLDLAHTWLAEQWLRGRRPLNETVAHAMADLVLAARLERLWQDEVMPVFAALGQEDAARVYLDEVRRRLANPCLRQRLSDIVRHQAEKKRRRLRSLVDLTTCLGIKLEQPSLQAALA